MKQKIKLNGEESKVMKVMRMAKWWPWIILSFLFFPQLHISRLQFEEKNISYYTCNSFPHTNTVYLTHFSKQRPFWGPLIFLLIQSPLLELYKSCNNRQTRLILT